MEKTIFSTSSFKILLAIAVGLILFVAAITKIVYPSQVLIEFYIGLGIFELILAVALIAYSTRWQAWAFLALVFAAWLGYSSYATIFGLPCPCLGAAIDLPRGTTLFVDSLVLVPSWAILLKDKRFTPPYFKKVVALSIVFFLVGFLFPEIIYGIS